MTEESKSTAVVNWSDQMAKYAVAVAKTETPSSGFISLKAGVLSYQGAAVPNNKLDVVVIHNAFENTFYEGKYDPNNVRSPVCFAIKDGDPYSPDSGTELAPHPDSESPQSDTCATCPNLKWKSDPNGGRGKACQERRRLLLIPASAIESPDKILTAEVAVMKLPVTSVKLWSAYVNTIATLNRRPPFALVTQIGTQPNAKSQFNVTFAALSALPDEVMDAIVKKREMTMSALLKGYDPSEDAPAPAADGKAKKY
jgi:hypothetical protein